MLNAVLFRPGLQKKSRGAYGAIGKLLELCEYAVISRYNPNQQPTAKGKEIKS
jgi:hypothetical protein